MLIQSRRSRPIALALAALAIAATTACDIVTADLKSQATADWRKTFSLEPGGRLGLFGFGASARLAIQVAVHWGCSVFVCTRSQPERRRALELGAAWAGGYDESPPEPLDAAITFAPSGDVVVAALRALDRGGTEPTVTDAMVTMGFIDPDRYLGGRVQLKPELSRQALDGTFGDRFGWSTEEAAAAVHDLVVVNMANAVREVSVGKGHDPREFALVAFGGAGPRATMSSFRLRPSRSSIAM